MDNLIRLNDEYYIATSSSRVDDRTRVLKHGDTFAVFDRFGDIQTFGQGEQGIYHEGTRFLSRLELLLGKQRPLLLNSVITERNTFFTMDLTNPDLVVGDQLRVQHGGLHLFRSKLLRLNVCYERIQISKCSGLIVYFVQLLLIMNVAHTTSVGSFIHGKGTLRVD